MGHLFILCGPPGCGKTTLLKMIKARKLDMKLVQRLTTRPSRQEEGDKGKRNLEYEFLTEEEFAGRISTESTANLVEWNGAYYATQTGPILRALERSNCLIYEDIPGSLALKRHFGSNATVILLFTEGLEELFRLVFATLASTNRGSIQEWRRRLQLKFRDSRRASGATGDGVVDYVHRKMRRAIPDLAFITSKIRDGEDIRVLANRRDQQKDTLAEFMRIVESVDQNRVVPENPGKFAFVLMPFRDSYNKIYRFVIKPAVEREGLSCLRGDEIFSKLGVVDDILGHIEASTVIISDISGGNPNVFLELGVSMKMNKPIILVTQDEVIPFDVRTCRTILYKDTLEGWEHLSSEIADALRKVKRREDIRSPHS